MSGTTTKTQRRDGRHASRRWLLAVLALGLAACRDLSGGGASGGDRAASPMLRPAEVSPATVAWTVFTSDVGRFSIEMPGQPVERPQAGVEKVFQFSEGKTAAYTVAYSDMPGRVRPQAALAGGMDGVAQAAKEVGTRKEVSFEGHPGLDSEFETQGLHVWYRFVLVKNRLYLMNVAAQNPVQADYAPRARRFFDSFKPDNVS